MMMHEAGPPNTLVEPQREKNAGWGALERLPALYRPPTRSRSPDKGNTDRVMFGGEFSEPPQRPGRVLDRVYVKKLIRVEQLLRIECRKDNVVSLPAVLRR